MNDRIFVLTACHFPRDGDGNISATPEMIMEFAELIVRECMDIALYGDEFEQARSNVKQHFGVEE